jgi:hypothetical protein
MQQAPRPSLGRDRHPAAANCPYASAKGQGAPSTTSWWPRPTGGQPLGDRRNHPFHQARQAHCPANPDSSGIGGSPRRERKGHRLVQATLRWGFGLGRTCPQGTELAQPVSSQVPASMSLGSRIPGTAAAEAPATAGTRPPHTFGWATYTKPHPGRCRPPTDRLAPIFGFGRNWRHRHSKPAC